MRKHKFWGVILERHTPFWEDKGPFGKEAEGSTEVGFGKIFSKGRTFFQQENNIFVTSRSD